jgi:hypothetical protein
MAIDTGETPESGATFPLSGDSLRNWLRTAGSFLFGEFESGSDLLGFLRDNGVVIRRQDFYSIRREVLNTAQEIGDNLPSLATLEDTQPDSLIPMGLTITDSGLDLSDAFLYRYHIEAINPDTGEVQDQFIAVASAYQLTFNEARDLIGSYFTGEYITEGFEVTDIALQSAFGNPNIL